MIQASPSSTQQNRNASPSRLFRNNRQPVRATTHAPVRNHYTAELEIAKFASMKAGSYLQESFGVITRKSHPGASEAAALENLTATSEKIIFDILEENFPAHNLASKRSGFRQKNNEHTWIVSPLDGELHFLMQQPMFTVSVALARKNEFVVGVVHVPVTGELFSAKERSGAYLGDQPMRTSRTNELGQAIINKISLQKKKDMNAQSSGSLKTNSDKSSNAPQSSVLANLSSVAREVREWHTPSLELAFLADGRLDACVALDMNIYDVAAGSVLVREAQGIVTDTKGASFTTSSKSLLAGNALIHPNLRSFFA